MTAHAQAMMRAGIDSEAIATTMKAEQDEIRAVERRRDDIAAFVAEGRQRSDILDQVARLARHMAGHLSQLDADGQRLVVVTLDLAGELEDPPGPALRSGSGAAGGLPTWPGPVSCRR